jgi:predicted AlkP superfamily pyrophosphatase or phosphodiesterase
MRLSIALGLSLLLAADSPAAEAPVKKVLLIGIDGCRPDAIEAAKEATNLHTLVREGAFSDAADVLGDRKTEADTSTGPGWSTALTGVWADKHGVTDNTFRKHNLKQYPSFFTRLREVRPQAKTAALVTWIPFQEHLFTARDGCVLLLDGDKKGYEEGDRQVTKAAEKLLTEGDADAVFVYFGAVDITGHGYGFHPRSPKYTKSLEVVDEQIGRILKALKNRPTYAKEDWLIIVCTDHGGRHR